MNLEVLLLDDRSEEQLFVDLERLAAYPAIPVQVWIPSRDEGLGERVARYCAGNTRFEVFAHGGARRGQRLAHAAGRARGDLLLALPEGATLDPRGLRELARVPRATRFLAAAPRAASAPLVGRFGLMEMLVEMLGPALHGASFAVAPAALNELGQRRPAGVLNPAEELYKLSALELAPYFPERSIGREWALGTPLVTPSSDSIDVERASAWRLQELVALARVAEHWDTSEHGQRYRAERLQQLGAAHVAALRVWLDSRNPHVRVA